MENTESKRTRKLPEGWIKTRLHEACEIILGQSPPSSTYNTEGIGLPFFQGKAEFGDLYPTPVKWCSEPGKIAEPHDVLVSVRAPVGAANLNREKSCIGRGLAAIRPKDSMGSLYFLYLLRHLEHELIQKATGTTFQAITGSVLRDQEIPLAPLDEQHRIVAEIEKQFTRLDAAVFALKRLQANLTRYKAAVLKAACEGRLVPQDPNDEPADKLLERILAQWEGCEEVTEGRKAGRLWGSGMVPHLSDGERSALPRRWIWVKVRDLGPNHEDVVQVGPMSMKSSEFEETGLPVLNVGSVQWGYFNEMKLNYLPFDKVVKFDRYRIKPGDVLFTRSGTVGRCAVAKPHQNGWLMTFHLLRVRVDKNLCLPEYLRIVFEGADHIRRQTREAAIGTTRAGFNTRLLEELDIPLPPIEEQHRIIEEVERQLSVVEEFKKNVTDNLARAGRLRQAILQKAFSGRLVPQDPNEESAAELLERIRSRRAPSPDPVGFRKPTGSNAGSNGWKKKTP